MAGPASPTWKDGRRSKYFPKNLQARYTQALNDPTLADLTENLAVLEIRIQELIGRLSAGGSGETWQTLQDEWSAFLIAGNDEDEEGQREALRNLGLAIQKGSREEATWKELYQVVEDHRRQSESKQRIAVQAQQVIAIDLVMGLMAQMVAAVKTSVYDHADPKTARKIIVDTSTTYRRLLGGGGDS